MKSLLSFILIILNCSLLVAQNTSKSNGNIFFCGYDSNKKANNLTDFITSASITVNSSTEEIVNKILKPLGLPHNFVLVPYPNIDNAVAITTKNGTRYIVYDENFMQSINRETGNWASWSILAHEIGHHLCGHTLVSVNSLPDQRQKELEADKFSGFILYKLGATLEQAQSAVKFASNNNDDAFSTHPNLLKRLAAIEKGYNDAKIQQNISNIDQTPSAESFISEGFTAYQNGNYNNAIELFTKALVSNPNNPIIYSSRGSTYFKLGNNAKAIENYNKAIELEKDNELQASLYILRAAIYDEIQNYYAVLADCQKAAQLVPTNKKELACIYSYSARAKDGLKDSAGALQDYNTSIALDPTISGIYARRGFLRAVLNDLRGAISDFSIVISMRPKEGSFYWYRGMAKYSLGDKIEACADMYLACYLGYKDEDACGLYSRNCR